MSAVAPEISDLSEQAATRGVRVVATVDDLGRIFEEDVAGVVCQRDLSPAFRSWIHGLDPECLPRARVTLEPDAVQNAVETIFEMSSMPVCAHRTELMDDIVRLAHSVAGLMKAPMLRMRLDVVTNNACRKFHVDAITARVVCTYRGTGTQYGTSVDGTDPQEVVTIAAGSPILLRGTNWPESPASGLRHRSPPIEGTGETRLMLVLDPIFDGELAD